MKILIITNTSNEEIKEDIWIAETFAKDENKILDYYAQTNKLTERLRNKSKSLVNFQ